MKNYLFKTREKFYKKNSSILSSLGVLILIQIIKIYKLFISPIMYPCCRFHPTCSTYAIEALTRYGILKGLILIIRRLSRCQPFSSKYGYDPLI